MNWLNFAYGALGIATAVAGALVPGLQFLVPVGVGIAANAAPSIVGAVIAKKPESKQ